MYSECTVHTHINIISVCARVITIVHNMWMSYVNMFFNFSKNSSRRLRIFFFLLLIRASYYIPTYKSYHYNWLAVYVLKKYYFRIVSYTVFFNEINDTYTQYVLPAETSPKRVSNTYNNWNTRLKFARKNANKEQRILEYFCISL